MSPALAETQLQHELEKYENDLSWVLGTYDTLIESYGNEFVAVLNRQVLSHAATIEELVENLQARHADDYRRIVIEFIYKEHPNLVLGHANFVQAR
jgi:hypothetical protein